MTITAIIITKNEEANIVRCLNSLQKVADEIIVLIDKAFQFNRLNHIIDQPIHYSGWYPDRKVRLFPKNNSKWVGDFVHEKLHTESNVEALKGDLLHFTYSSIEQMAKKQQQYAEFGAQELFNRGKHVSKIERFLKVSYKFFSIYCLKLGFLDGSNGFKIALMSAKYLNLKYELLENLEEQKAH